jgi:hypothetical protein
MTTTSEELAFVSLGGAGVSYSHAVLIETAQGWHLELEDVPQDSCPFIEGECEIVFDSWDGEHWRGRATTSYAAEDPTYVVLTGVGELEHGGSDS